MKRIWNKILWAALLTAAFTLSAGCSSESSGSGSSQAGQESSQSAQTATNEIEAVSGEPYTYEINDNGTISITGYTGEETSVEVPATIDGYIVAEIANHAFEANEDIQKIVLPDGITVIGESAFADCTGLIDITIPETVYQISRAAFANCTSLGDLCLPAAVSVVQEEAFTNCVGLLHLEIQNPNLEYQSWGLIEGTEPMTTMIFAQPGSAIETWAQENNYYHIQTIAQ